MATGQKAAPNKVRKPKKKHRRGTKQGKRRAAQGHDAPHRMCIASREVRPQTELLRFVRAPSGAVCFDVSGRMDGRGAWVVPSEASIRAAVERGAFGRAFQAPVQVEADALVHNVRATLAAEACRHLGLARRASLAVPGRDKAIEACARGHATVLVLASDLAERSVNAVTNKVTDVVIVVRGPRKDQIGHALGRRETGVVALGEGPLVRRLVQELTRGEAMGWLPAALSSLNDADAARGGDV